MTTLALDENWDIIVDEDECLSTVNGCEEIIQCIKQNIRAIDFTPLFREGNREVISSLIKSTILNTNGVLSINSYLEQTSDVDCGNFRNFLISFSATTVCGNIQVVA